MLGVLHEAQRFAGLHQLRGFCGLFPRTSSSGGGDKPGQTITQSGNNRIKRALYLAADAARRIDPGLAAVYWRLMVRKGHHHKQALCAVATRLANRIGKVLRTGKAYELRDIDGTPISVAKARPSSPSGSACLLRSERQASMPPGSHPGGHHLIRKRSWHP